MGILACLGIDLGFKQCEHLIAGLLVRIQVLHPDQQRLNVVSGFRVENGLGDESADRFTLAGFVLCMINIVVTDSGVMNQRKLNAFIDYLLYHCKIVMTLLQ